MPRPKKTNRSDGRYEIRRTIGYDAQHHRIQKSFYGKDRAEAERKYLDYLDGIEKKKQAQKSTLFSAWVNEWLYTYKKPDVKPTSFLTTYERPCKNYILPYFENVILQDITQAEIKRFLNTLTDKSQSLIDKIVICLRGIFETAIDNDLIAKNPCRNVTAKSKAIKGQKRTYDQESVDALCRSDHKYALYVRILLQMGLRCSELCGLKWEDIDFEKGTLNIERALTVESGRIYIDRPKSDNSVRRLPIPKELLDELQAVQGTGYIAMINGRHITPDHFGKRQMEVFYNSMGVPAEQRLSPHELRHSCGTLLYEKTKDIYYVSRFLGHSDIGITTKTYVHSEMQSEKIHISFLK